MDKKVYYDGSSTGKSVSMLTKQRDRTLAKLDARIERAEQNGASESQLADMRRGRTAVAIRANSMINNAKKASGIERGEEIVGNSKAWKQVDRSVYTKVNRPGWNGTQMNASRVGQVGQFREGSNGNKNNTRNGGNTRGTKTRRINQMNYGRNTAYENGFATGSNNVNSRKQVAGISARNASMRYGVEQAVSRRYSSQQKYVDKIVNGTITRGEKGAITKQKNKTRENAPLRHYIRYQRRQRRKTGYSEY